MKQNSTNHTIGVQIDALSVMDGVFQGHCPLLLLLLSSSHEHPLRSLRPYTLVVRSDPPTPVAVDP